jgi:hypothetical protein
MTQEQDATNWQLLRQYKELRAEIGQRETQAKNWGHAMQRIGNLLASGGISANLDFASLPDKSGIFETRQELSLLYDQIAGLRRSLERVGMAGLL